MFFAVAEIFLCYNKPMPYRHEKFITAIVIIATLWLPLFSDASFQESFGTIGVSFTNSLIAIGSTLDKTISLTTSLPSRATHVLATTIDYASQSILTAAEDVSRSTYHAADAAWQAGTHRMSSGYSMLRSLPKQISNYKSRITNVIDR